MRKWTILLVLLLSASLVACGSSTKKKVANEEMKAKGDARVQLTKEYRECVSKAGGDKEKVKACDSYLDAIKKLK